MRPVRDERTGWRDEALSLRHRLWGFDAPAVDVDWLVIEYDNCEPVALVDYKESRSPRVGQPTDANSKAIGRTGERGGIPAFAVRYHRGQLGYEFFPIPLNDLARGLLPTERRMDEVAYVRWIYRLRGRDAPTEVLAAIRTEPVAA